MTGEEFQDMLKRAKAGFKDRYEEGREDYRQAYYAARNYKVKTLKTRELKLRLL